MWQATVVGITWGNIIFLSLLKVEQRSPTFSRDIKIFLIFHEFINRKFPVASHVFVLIDRYPLLFSTLHSRTDVI